MLVLFVVPALLVYRRRPEDVGLLPDGDPPESPETDARKPRLAPEFSWTVAEAVRTRALWLIVAGMFIGTLANGSVSFHLVAFYTDKGLSTSTAALAISLFALFGAIASIVWGFLVERFSERLLLTVAMVLSGFCMWAMLPTVGAPAALSVAALYGLVARGEGTLVNIILAQYYGRESYGRIAGVTSPFNMVALGLGPLTASLSYDLTGAYTTVYAIFGFTYLISAILLWLARRPALPVREESELLPVSAAGR
jgi:MFS family permease